MTPDGKTCGERVRDLLKDVDGPNPAVPMEYMGEPCPYHLPMERKIERIGTALGFIGDAIEEIKVAIVGLRQSNGVQSADIAALKARAAVYGALGACVASPFAVGAALLFLDRMMK